MIQAPPSWTVRLVDNAGFGEAGQEGIIKQATTALVTSSAYVYIMSYENLGDRKDVAAFQRIYDKDRGEIVLELANPGTLYSAASFLFHACKSMNRRKSTDNMILYVNTFMSVDIPINSIHCLMVTEPLE